MTVRGCDSWWQPSAQQIATAKANGIGAWLGYFSDGHDGIYGGGWSDDTFRLVQSGGLLTAAFCSYRAYAATWKARAEALGIVLILDVERSVDGGDGPAVDPWLAASGARLYGCGPGAGTPNVMTTHLMHGHSGYQVADYRVIPGSGSLSWPAQPRPGIMPTAWQYAGTQTKPWGDVDLGVYDEAFISPGVPEEEEMAWFLYTVAGGDGTQYVFTGSAVVAQDNVTTIEAMVAQGCLKTTTPSTVDAAEHARFVAATTPATGGLTAVQDAELSAVVGTVARIETALKGA
jgi:hypothetical protein